MQGIMLRDSLGKLCWIEENRGPIGESSEVFVHIFAGVEGFWDLENNNA